MSQPITVQALDAHRVHLFRSDSPEFARALDPERAKQFDIFAPYSVLIQNDTDKVIIGYSARWFLTDNFGKPNAAEITVFDFSPIESSNLAPHMSRFVSLLSDFGSGGRQWDVALEGEVNRLMALFTRQPSILIRLDAVLFKDGSAIGPDGNGWIPRWKAYIDAERDIYTSASRTPSTEIRAFLSKSSNAAFDIVRSTFQGEQWNDTHLLLAANKSGSYERCYALLRGYFATRLLTSLDRDGDEPAMQQLKEVIASKTYPNVHREEF